MITPTLLAPILTQHGYLAADQDAAAVQIEPLGGGVSNEVFMVRTPSHTLVVKQALPKLRVAMEWYADQTRIWRERDYLEVVGAWLPTNVPRVLFYDEAHYLLAIEAIREATLWKSLLMAGECDPAVAARAGSLLAQIHSHTHAQPELATRFARRDNRPEDSFEQLRIDPYWRTVAARHPAIAPAITQIIEAMEAAPVALVHGDYSPKNIFVKPDGDLIILDAEVAHWGDPTFDVAFCLNHFLLKAVYHGEQGAPFRTGAGHFWRAYQAALQPAALAEGIRARLPGQLAAMLLARVDGKSPVEYLVGRPEQQAYVRDLALQALAQYPNLSLAALGVEV